MNLSFSYDDFIKCMDALSKVCLNKENFIPSRLPPLLPFPSGLPPLLPLPSGLPPLLPLPYGLPKYTKFDEEYDPLYPSMEKIRIYDQFDEEYDPLNPSIDIKFSPLKLPPLLPTPNKMFMIKNIYDFHQEIKSNFVYESEFYAKYSNQSKYK